MSDLNDFIIKNGTLVRYKGRGGEVEIPDGVIVINPEVFTSSPITSVKFPNTLVMICDSAFNNCIELESLELPESLRLIGANAFYKCLNLKSVKFPENLVTLGDKVFYGCLSLKAIRIPGSLKVIPNMAFYGCIELSNVIIENGVEVICNGAFYGTATKSISLPPSIVQAIGKEFNNSGQTNYFNKP